MSDTNTSGRSFAPPPDDAPPPAEELLFPSQPVDPDPARLTAADKRDILLWIAAGVVGVMIAARFFLAAFPEASLELKISREQALATAQQFVAEVAPRDAAGNVPAGHQSAIVFGMDENSKTFLEREAGLEEANRLMRDEVNVWAWHARFFRELQKEEFRVQVDPAGRIVAYDHVLEEAHAGASLERDAAHAIAENFLRAQLRAAVNDWEFLDAEANPIDRPNRRDWSFTWERRGFKAAGAPYRYTVRVQGAHIGGYDEFLKVPEQWIRDYERLRSTNLLYQNLAQLPYIFLTGAVVLLVIDLGKRNLVRWRGALLLGLVLAILFFTMFANQWPIDRAGYNTTDSYAGFFLQTMAMAALFSVVAALVAALSVAAGEPLYRKDFPPKLRLGVTFSRASWLEGLRSKEFFRACVIGLSMAAAHIGFVVAFYLIGRQFGVWAPQDVNYTDTLSTAIPWIYPLTISIYASTSEEFMFRLFAIPLVMRLTRSKWIAIIVPAVIWGFLHSAYPQQPGFIRGIEVGIIGVVAGWVMLRWGILTTLIWHYTVDALLIALFLLRSDNLYFRLSGGFVAAMAVFPLLLALAFYFTRRSFAASPDLFNASQPVDFARRVPEAEEPQPLAPSAAGYRALSGTALSVLLAAAAVGVFVTVSYQPERIGDFVTYSTSSAQAAERADAIMKQRGADPAAWRRAVITDASFSGHTNEYLRRNIGIGATNKLYEQRVPSAFWRVRYFKDSEKEEYAVILKPDGALHSVHHLLPEKADGANLLKEEAVARGEAWLRENKQLDMAQWKLVESESEKRPNRTDHTLTWEEIAPIAGDQPTEAHIRVQLQVLGDEVSTYRTFVKVPEEWQRRQNERSLPKIAYFIFQIVFFVGLGVTALVMFFMNIRKRRVPWRQMSRWALWAALALFITVLNGIPQLMAAYPTEMPLKTFIALILIGNFIFVAALYSALFLVFSLAWFFLSWAFGEERIPAWSGMPRQYYRDALALGIAAAALLPAIGRLALWIDRVWPAPKNSVGVALPAGFGATLPALSEAAGAVMLALGITGLLALTAGVLAVIGNSSGQGGARRVLTNAAFVVLLAVVMAGSWGSRADFAKSLLISSLMVAAGFLAVTRIFRFNMLAYFLAAVFLALILDATTYLRQPNEVLRLNGYLLLVTLLAFIAWPLFQWLRGKANPVASQPPAPPSASD